MTNEYDDPSVSSPNPPARKYVTRACDACKKRKSKCDGCEPCTRCLNSSLECKYVTSYNRVQRRHQPYNRNEGQESSKSCRPHKPDRNLPQKTSDGKRSHTEANVSRVGDDSSDPSVHAFMGRISSHLAQIGQGLPRNLFKREQDVMNGDSEVHPLILPNAGTAKGYVTCYFEHANVTYRYLPRKEMFELLEQVYKEERKVLQNHIKMAKILLVMGIGCIWMSSWRNEPILPFKTKACNLLQAAQSRLDRTRGVFPPTLELLQAHVLKCQLELYSSRFNSAWMTLGFAVRLGQVIDIQKDVQSSDDLEVYSRRSLFWTMFIIDRYLSISLGRPMAIHQQDVAVLLPTNLKPSVISSIGAQEAKVSVGAVAHARLALVLGHAISRLYPPAGTISTETEKAIGDLEAEMNQWLQDTPAFFHPPGNSSSVAFDPAFYDVPWLFKRQQRTIRAAYYFVNMIIYRSHLLREFLQQAPSTPRSGPSSEYVTKCVENALAMAKLAADAEPDEYAYNSTFWTTSYFIFCAISILLVYLTMHPEAEDRATIGSVVQEAMKVHRKLDTSANMNTQKLLEESRSVAEHLREASLVSPTQDESGQVVAECDGGQVVSDANAPSQPSFQLGDSQWQRFDMEQDAHLVVDLPRSDEYGTTNDFAMIMDIGFDSTMFRGTCNSDFLDF